LVSWGCGNEISICNKVRQKILTLVGRIVFAWFSEVRQNILTLVGGIACAWIVEAVIIRIKSIFTVFEAVTPVPDVYLFINFLSLKFRD
jgi:hypothetical protein